jgi:hypothetical protein
MIEVESWPIAGAPTTSAIASLIVPCSRVSHDLLIDPQVTAKLRYREWWVGDDGAYTAPEGWTIIGLKGDGPAQFAVGVDLAVEDFALTARLAEVVQDELTGYEFIQWPQCPSHQRIMFPGVADSEAWWTCKGPDSHRIRIGDLSAAGARRKSKP